MNGANFDLGELPSGFPLTNVDSSRRNRHCTGLSNVVKTEGKEPSAKKTNRILGYACRVIISQAGSSIIDVRMFFYVVGTLAMLAEGRGESMFIPGSGCGTLKTIKTINGSPTLKEETEGCVYIRKGPYDKSRGKFRKNMYCTQ